MIVILVIVGLGLLFFLLFHGSQANTKQAMQSIANWQRSVRDQTKVGELVLAQRGAIGFSSERGALAVIEERGSGKWIPLARIAGVELTPFYTRTESSSADTSTKRGSQLLGAGLGAAVAGPAGAVIGGLSGGTKTVGYSSSSEHLSHAELKLRLFSDETPLLKLRFSYLDDVEQIAARIATAIERRPQGSRPPEGDGAFETFAIAPFPSVQTGWWRATFG